MLRARSTKEATALRTTVQITHLLQAVISIDNTAKQTWNHIRVTERTAVWEIEWYLGKQKIRRWFFFTGHQAIISTLHHMSPLKKKKKQRSNIEGIQANHCSGDGNKYKRKIKWRRQREKKLTCERIPWEVQRNTEQMENHDEKTIKQKGDNEMRNMNNERNPAPTHH